MKSKDSGRAKPKDLCWTALFKTPVLCDHYDQYSLFNDMIFSLWRGLSMLFQHSVDSGVGHPNRPSQYFLSHQYIYIYTFNTRTSKYIHTWRMLDIIPKQRGHSMSGKPRRCPGFTVGAHLLGRPKPMGFS